MNKRLLLLLPIAGATAVVFQNCSNVALEKYVAPSVYVAPAVSLKAEMCGDIRQTAGASTKYIFMIDMSRSNIGEFEKNGENGNYYWKGNLGTDPNPTSGGFKTTDQNRFTAVYNFLDTCGASSSTAFKIVAFSKTAGVPTGGTINGNAVSTMLRCDLPAHRQFDSVSVAKSSVVSLFNIQQSDRLFWEGFTNVPYKTTNLDQYVMGETAYPAAMKCLQDIVLDDLDANNSDLANYKIFFITDGAPQDPLGGPCYGLSTKAASDACYLNKSLESLTMVKTAALMKGRSLSLNGVFYNSNPGSGVPSVLTQISQEGGSDPLQISGFSDAKAGLCKLTQTSSSLDWKPESYGVVNLTLIRSGGKLKADSDMDGIPDDLDPNPLDPRSMVPEILDGICKSLGGQQSCQEKYSAISNSCNPSTYSSGYQLNDCEIKILGLDTLAAANGIQAGVDSDLDGVPDFVEIIKGLNPKMADANLDYDGDGVKNIDEVFQGRDPLVADSDIPDSLLNKLSINYTSTGSAACPSGAWQMDLTRAQVLKTAPLVSNDAKFSLLNHNSNQHVLLLYYRQATQNSVGNQLEYRAKFVKMDYSVSNKQESVKLETGIVSKDQFELMGKAGK